MEIKTSVIWLVVMLIGAATATYGNIQFNVSREKERSESANKKALSILKKELENNLSIVKELRKLLAQGQMTTMGLQMSAWKVISEGGVLVQLDSELMGQITEVYNYTDTLNTLHGRIWDLSFGASAAMSSTPTIKPILLNNLSQGADSLEPKLDALIKASEQM